MPQLGGTLVAEKKVAPNKVLRMFHYVLKVGFNRKTIDMMRIEVEWNGQTTIPIRMERKLWEVCKELD